MCYKVGSHAVASVPLTSPCVHVDCQDPWGWRVSLLPRPMGWTLSVNPMGLHMVTIWPSTSCVIHFCPLHGDVWYCLKASPHGWYKFEVDERRSPASYGNLTTVAKKSKWTKCTETLKPANTVRRNCNSPEMQSSDIAHSNNRVTPQQHSCTHAVVRR